MLTSENFYDIVEDTGYLFVNSKSPSPAPLKGACLFPDEPLLVITTADGSLSLQSTNENENSRHFELLLKSSYIPGSSQPKFHRVNRKYSNIVALGKRQIIFTHHVSNQLLISNLPPKNSQFEHNGDPVFQLGVHESPISTISVDDMGSLLISGDVSGCLRLWPLSWDALRSDDSRWKPQPTPSPLFRAHDSNVKEVVYVNQTISQIQNFVSIGSDVGIIKVWNLLRDTQSVRASLIHSLECGPVNLLNISAHGKLCSASTECNKLFLWDYHKLELLMVAEETSVAESHSVYSTKQSMCVCGNQDGSVKVFRPNSDGSGWQVMAECFLGSRVLLNQVNDDCLFLSAGTSFEDLVLKQWQVSELPSSSVVSQTSTLPEPRPCPPQPTPKVSVYPTPSMKGYADQPIIEDVGNIDDFSQGDRYEDEEDDDDGQNSYTGEDDELGSDQEQEVVEDSETAEGGEMLQKYSSVLASAKLNSTAASRSRYSEVKHEKFRSGSVGVSEEGRKVAARLPDVPLEDHTRYDNLENLNPVLPPPAAIKKQVDAKWEAQVRSCCLQDEDFYLPHWESLNTIGKWPVKETGRELLADLRDRKKVHLDSDLVWSQATAMRLGIGGSCFD